MICHTCGKTLSRDEVGLSRKLINRATDTFFCLDCLAARFRADKASLLAMIERFREAGCTLFT